MQFLKTTLTALILGILLIPLLGCGSEEENVLAQESQTTAVQRGYLVLEITAAGNLALSHTEDLTVDLFYGQSGATGTKGTIGEVLVEEGDTVEEGQILATIDADEWNDELTKLEKAQATAQRSLTAKQSALTNAERQVIAYERTVIEKEIAVAAAERTVATKELAVRQAEINLQTAEYNLNKFDEVNEAIEDVEDAELNLKIAIMGLTGELAGLSNDYDYWTQLVTNAREELEYKKHYDCIIVNNNYNEALQNLKSVLAVAAGKDNKK